MKGQALYKNKQEGVTFFGLNKNKNKVLYIKQNKIYG